MTNKISKMWEGEDSSFRKAFEQLEETQASMNHGMVYTEDVPYNKRDHTHCPEKDSPCGIQGSHRCCLCEEPVKANYVQTGEIIECGHCKPDKGYSLPEKWGVGCECKCHTSSQEVGWEKRFDLVWQYASPEKVKEFISILLADKAKVLREELEKMLPDTNTYVEDWEVANAKSETLSDVLKTITRILR